MAPDIARNFERLGGAANGPIAAYSRGRLEITHIEGQMSWATRAYELTSTVARRSIIPNRPWL
jgi:hypothetical protein